MSALSERLECRLIKSKSPKAAARVCFADAVFGSLAERVQILLSRQHVYVLSFDQSAFIYDVQSRGSTSTGASDAQGPPCRMVRSACSTMTKTSSSLRGQQIGERRDPLLRIDYRTVWCLCWLSFFFVLLLFCLFLAPLHRIQRHAASIPLSPVLFTPDL